MFFAGGICLCCFHSFLVIYTTGPSVTVSSSFFVYIKDEARSLASQAQWSATTSCQVFLLCCRPISCFLFETGSQCVVQLGLELIFSPGRLKFTAVLPQPPTYWDYSSLPLYFLFILRQNLLCSSDFELLL